MSKLGRRDGAGRDGVLIVILLLLKEVRVKHPLGGGWVHHEAVW